MISKTQTRGERCNRTLGVAVSTLIVHVFWLEVLAVMSPEVFPQNILLLCVVITDSADPSHQQVNHFYVHFQYPETGRFETAFRADGDVFPTDIRHFQTFIIDSIRFIILQVESKVTLANIIGCLQLYAKFFAKFLIAGRIETTQ